MGKSNNLIDCREAKAQSKRAPLKMIAAPVMPTMARPPGKQARGKGTKSRKPEWDSWFFESEASGSEAV